ncbi:hypothetical protein TNCV_2566731 [Trichonephila clavipes]|uniref:Uncharacterized protein n=1 Tax=Trichonephila clavipes TaxID=2585209 RepID=A0A8X6WMG5_TRICX|nr:hypothetical protein TNCV_2566731 [Trichonephila clavipes]
MVCVDTDPGGNRFVEKGSRRPSSLSSSSGTRGALAAKEPLRTPLWALDKANGGPAPTNLLPDGWVQSRLQTTFN